MNRTIDNKQVASGLIFAAIGILALWRLPHQIGTIRAMGAGYFPMILGICLIAFGTGSVVQGIRSKISVVIGGFPVVATAVIVLGIIAFALLLHPLGLAVSLAVLVIACSYRRILVSPLELLLIYAVLLGLTWFVFIDLIQLPVDLYVGWGAT